MFKKIVLTITMLALLSMPAMADNGYYFYQDEAVKGGYEQSALPVQGIIVNGAAAYGDLAASADLIVIQALPMTQSMGGVGFGGAMINENYKYENTNINLDRITLNTVGGWDYDNYNYYNYYNINVYNPQYNYYYNYYPIYNQNGYGEYNVDFTWTNIDYYKNSNESIYTSIPLASVLEKSAAQGFENSLSFESGSMKLNMTQSGFQAGSLKVVGYGSSTQNGCYDGPR